MADENQEVDAELTQAKMYLNQRYEALSELNTTFKNEVASKGSSNSEKIVLTDLYVEKDIGVQTERAKLYRLQGDWLFAFSAFILFCAFVFASHQLMHWKLFVDLGVDVISEPKDWKGLVYFSIKSITVYGIAVLLAVTLWRQGKAKLDQAERIFEKRRTNRVVRLFVHLNDGELTIDQLEKLLAWSNVESTAFSNIKADGKAPLAHLVGQLLKFNSELISQISTLNKSNKDD